MTTVNPKMVPKLGLELSHKSIVLQLSCLCVLEIYTYFYTFQWLAVSQIALSSPPAIDFVTARIETACCPKITPSMAGIAGVSDIYR